MWQQGGPAGGPASAQAWNPNAQEFVPGGADRGRPGPAPPGPPMGPGAGMGQRPPMPQGYPANVAPGAYSAHWQPGPAPTMPPAMQPGMQAPGWAGPGMNMDAWRAAAAQQQQWPGGPPPGAVPRPPPPPYGGQQAGPGPNAAMPSQAELPRAAPENYAAIWNLQPQTDYEGLQHELNELDFMPEKLQKIKDIQGAFMLGYSEFPFLAGAICLALNETEGHLKDNGKPIRVVTLPKADETIPDMPLEVLKAFQELKGSEPQ